MGILLPLSVDRAPTIHRRLIVLRWWFLVAEAVAIAVLPMAAEVALPQAAMFLVIGLQTVANAWAWQRPCLGDDDCQRQLFGQLVVDVVALAVLMFFSGGAANPVISLLLPPVAIAALALSARQAITVTVLAVVAYSTLMVVYLPLAIADSARATRLHLLGMWITFVASAVMVTWFVVRMTAIIRARDAELLTIREQALRDERVLALGAQAAGAAHELSTPLATMAILAGELEHDAQLGASARADIAVLRQQIAACKGIISSMAERAGVGRADSIQAQRADSWLRRLFERWQALRPSAPARLEIRGGLPAPAVVAEATLDQGLLNLFNNGADAGSEVCISVDWQDGELSIEVRDDGPGFPPAILAESGRAPLPPHARGSGIGLFLARTAIERMGGRMLLTNDPGGVARVILPCDGS